MSGQVTGYAQKLTEVEGRVLDDADGKPLPFVNVYFKGSNEGATTDERGFFQIKAYSPYDSVVASFVGYRKKVVPIVPGKKQNLLIRLQSETVSLDEVVVLSGENPAWQIIRNAVKNKKNNDKRQLAAYEYSSYNRIEFDIDNLSDKMKKRKMIREIFEGIDSTALEKNANGNAILPIFLSETVSRYYVKNEPYARREEVKKTKIVGVAVEDGSMLSQLTGSTYQEYNFYRNWLTILEKEFISPISDSWRLFYDYEIVDTVMLGQYRCYELDLYPRRREDPAFNGKIWITTDDYALKKLDVYIDKSTNLNFIESIIIKQELGRTADGPWLPEKTVVIVDVSNLGKNAASILIKMYNTTKDWKINDVKDQKFYANEVILVEDYNRYPVDFWESVRPPDLNAHEVKAYQIIDTLVNIPRVKTMVDIVKLISTGYWRRGKVDIGPYLYAYAYNNYEGHSFRLGLKTNEYFHDKLTLKGYLGYGTRDNRWKYGLRMNFIIKRRPWTELKLQSAYDVEQVGIRPEDLIESNYIFYAATRWQTFRRPYYISKNSLSIRSEIARGLTQTVTLRHDYFDPQFSCYYYKNPDGADLELQKQLSAPTVKYSLRWARDERFIQNGNERISLGPKRAPAIQFDYTYGFKDILNSNFEFHKMQLEIIQKMRLGSVGEGIVRLKGGYIFGQIPYLLLENHIGNESLFYTTGAYNTMNFFEFVSDKYASLRYEHYFQGMIMNRLPLLRKLKWRLLGTANILYGSLRQENIDIMSPVDPDGNPAVGFGWLDPTLPYIELGYGIENILKFMRLDGVHRLTYREVPGAQKFTLKVSFQFKL